MIEHRKILLTLFLVFFVQFLAMGQIAKGKSKFIGCAYSSAQATDFQNYWNQVTPENAGKWGSVEGTRNVMNWSGLDQAYDFAKQHGFLFKMHNLIWGNQQPTWIDTLDTATQLQEIKQWFSLVAARYDSIDMIDVVNEPINTPPDKPGRGNYINALGGTGTTGWDWVITAFRLARQDFPHSKLLLNEYNIVNNSSKAQEYARLIRLLKADTLIDGIGVQCHTFSLIGTSASTIQTNLDTLAAIGLPIYVSEMDIVGTDITQLQEYQKLFPVFWEDTAVKGITFWGYRPGLWQKNANLVTSSGADRPAMTWLKAYVDSTYVPVDSITVTATGGTPAITTNLGTLQMNAAVLPMNATFRDVTWSVNSSSIASISSSGMLTAKTNGTVTVIATSIEYHATKGTLDVKITNNKPSGIKEIGLNGENITIYPNPADNGNFHIDGIQNIQQIKIMDITGKTVKELNTKNRSSVLIRLNAAPGIYIVRLSNKQNSIYKKIMIKYI